MVLWVPVHTQGSLLGGRYRVVRHLGSGGMASVLLCRDERLDREVAVKRLHADSPADVEQRFVREAKLGASLNHPNLVSVFDTATDDEGVLIVMEYVEGEALARTLKRGPLPPGRVASMVRDVGSALDHAHGQGVVHRDVKPGNVLLRHDGVTKLVDLGIATAQDHTRLTHSGMVLGTAAYMAPEQLEGGETTAATDVYALAVVAYEALTGAVPPTRTVARPAPVPAPVPVPAPAPEPAAAKPPPPTGPSRRPDRGRGKRPIGAIALALVFLALAAATVIAAVLSSGDDGGEPQQAGNGRQEQPNRGNQERQEPRQQEQQQQEQAPAEPDPAPEE